MTGIASAPRSGSGRQQTRNWLAQRRAERVNRAARRRGAAADGVGINAEAVEAASPEPAAAQTESVLPEWVPCAPAGEQPETGGEPTPAEAAPVPTADAAPASDGQQRYDAPLCAMPEIGPGLREHLAAIGIDSVSALAAADAVALNRDLPELAFVLNLEWIIGLARARLAGP